MTLPELTLDPHRAKRKLRVGVTLYIRDDQQSIWENGIFQNCYFLVLLLNRSPFVEQCFVVNGGPGDPKTQGDFVASSPAPIIDLDEAMNALDVVVELSAQLNPDWGREFRSHGGKIVGMHVANDHIIDVERMMYGLPHGMLMSGVPYDVIWTLPAFEKTCKSYYEYGFRAPVSVMQHLWTPFFLEHALKRSGKLDPFFYSPGRQRWRLAILEPNICSVKTCHLPMLLCDAAYRRDRQFVEYLRVYNAMKLKEHHGFVGFARSLDLVNHGLATFEPRLPIFDILPDQGDAVVSHHWHNGQNYLYYEALYGGYALIHNSAFLDDCGYRYGDYDCEDGALALLQAHREHDRSLGTYRAKARQFLAKLDPCSERNVAAYSAALLELVEDGRQ
jgi:hypothetical protein